MSRTRFVGLYAIVAAAASVILAPLLALSYFAIPDGAKELKTGTVSAWADPARDAAGSLLTFASADRVYATYTQLFAVITPAVLLCAWLTMAGRQRIRSRLERVAWRVVLLGYGLFTVGLIADAIVVIAADPSSGWTDLAFVPLMLPGIVLGVIGSSVLGIALVRNGFRPRVSAWLLALALPGWMVGSTTLGHNSMGIVPLMVAWGVAGRRLAGEPDAVRAPSEIVPRSGPVGRAS